MKHSSSPCSRTYHTVPRNRLMYLLAHKAEWDFERKNRQERRTARSRIRLCIMSHRQLPVPHQDPAPALTRTRTPPIRTPRTNGQLTQIRVIPLTSALIPLFP